MSHDTTSSIAARAGEWHRQSRARKAILACVAADERPLVRFDTYAQTRDEYIVPGIELGRKVEAIRASYGAAALAHGDATDDYGLFDAWCASPDAATAILNAFAEARREGAAA